LERIVRIIGSKKGGYEMADKTLTCKDCGAEFIFTESEQEFYKEKGFDNEPMRCQPCRKSRKQQRNSSRPSGGGRGFGNSGNRW
jgi:hypothetical protein